MSLNIHNSVLVLIQIWVTMLTINSESVKDYFQERNELLKEDLSTFFGQNITLSDKEQQVNDILLQAKINELDKGYKNSSEFLPSLHFFQAKEKIDQSGVFAFIRKIPKGASLHTHLLAAASVDFLIKNISYRDYLYGGYVNNVFKLKFLSDPKQDNRSEWKLLKEMREEQGAENFDQWLKEQLILNTENPKLKYPNVETVWKKFKNIFTTTYDLFAYRPVFEEYVNRVLQELYDDNVMYTELKGTIMPLYELNGTIHSSQKFFEVFIEAVNRFKTQHPNFLGVRYIHSIYRGVDEDVLQAGLQEIIEMKNIFPDFIAGFDFVGYEEEGNSIKDYVGSLLKARENLNYFFHAGETNWFGHTDLNLLDAILLNSSRIGHGFALTKHPKLLELCKERNIPLEICPISNQVLMLNEDPRNHPAAVLMSLNYPILVCNDDPSTWNSTGLSYDWYVVFMAMTPKTGGLEILKQLAVNSIIYSSMDEEEKQEAINKWKKDWDNFLNEIVMKNVRKIVVQH